MLAAIIDNGSTWLLNIKDNVEITSEEIVKEWNSRYVGWIVNTDDISEVMWGMPVSRYMIKDTEGKLKDISVKTAHYIYEELPKIRNITNKTIKK